MIQTVKKVKGVFSIAQMLANVGRYIQYGINVLDYAISEYEKINEPVKQDETPAQENLSYEENQS